MGADGTWSANLLQQQPPQLQMHLQEVSSKPAACSTSAFACWLWCFGDALLQAST